MIPSRRGATAHPFFSASLDPEAAASLLLAAARKVSIPLPAPLLATYEAYTADTEFTCDGTVFLSEQEIKERTRVGGTIDFALRYAGLGHVVVHTLVEATGAVLSLVDGGANGWDREANAEARNKDIVSYVERGGGVPSRSFSEWVEQEAPSLHKGRGGGGGGEGDSAREATEAGRLGDTEQESLARRSGAGIADGEEGEERHERGDGDGARAREADEWEGSDDGEAREAECASSQGGGVTSGLSGDVVRDAHGEAVRQKGGGADDEHRVEGRGGEDAAGDDGEGRHEAVDRPQ